MCLGIPGRILEIAYEDLVDRQAESTRRLLEHCGYEIQPRSSPVPKPEIECLMEWMLGDATTLATHHPEFALTRDMVALYKYLSTIESREAELMRRRVGSEDMRYMAWSLSFDDDAGGRFSHSLQPMPLRWEVIGFRGTENSRESHPLLAPA